MLRAMGREGRGGGCGMEREERGGGYCMGTEGRIERKRWGRNRGDNEERGELCMCCVVVFLDKQELPPANYFFIFLGAGDPHLPLKMSPIFRGG